MTKQAWAASDISNPIRLRYPLLDFQDHAGNWHTFTVIATEDRVVFGGVCNVGFLESGYIARDSSETLDESLSELFSDLQAYYNDGPQYVSRIVCNERM